ncbi:MAG TPA: hypothetical protein VMZ25_03375, partial [Terriglobales bacterium]|nr:hypothetical protein [Terriglobales bacterium]
MFAVFRQLMQLMDRKPVDPELLKINSFFLELFFWILVVALTALFLKWRPRWITVFERLMVRFSRRRFAVVVTMGILALALRLATFPWNPVPTPGIHDEF